MNEAGADGADGGAGGTDVENDSAAPADSGDQDAGAAGSKAAAEGAEGEGDAPGAGEAEGADGDGEAGEGEGEVEGAPETYEDFTIPEDYKSLVTEAEMAQFTDLAKDLGLNQEEAQKLVDYRVQQMNEMAEAYTAQTEQWAEDTAKDEELGGADHELKLAAASKAYKALVNDKLQVLMDPYHPVDNPQGLGLGNHPEVVRLFYRIGVNLSEDSLALPNSEGAGAAVKLPRETVLYGQTESE
jgi:hypothetical protein